MKLIAVNQTTLTNLKERAIERTDVTFWHGLSAVKHPLGVYDCGYRDHSFANEFNVTSGKTYTVRVIAKRTKGALKLSGGIWYTAMSSGHPYDSYGSFTLVGEESEDGLGIYERKVVVASGKTKGMLYIQLEQTAGGGYSTAYRIYDGQVFDENGQPLVTDQNNFGALTSPMAAPDGTYIWKRTITYYTDGTNSTVWEYSGVGSKGQDGQDGKTSHVHYAFADNATGGGFSLTTPKAYMGWYTDFNESASNDPTKYKWGKWKGDQGAPGGKGDDGKTSYLHLAYASSADGKTGFSFTDTKQQYQGYYTDFTQTSSTDPTKYVWVDRLANVKVGGVNLLRNSKSFTGSNISGSAKLLTETYNGCAVRYFKSSAWGEIAQFSKCVVPEVNSVYTASFWAKGNGKIRAYFYGDPNYLNVLSGSSSQGASTSAPDGAIDFTVTTEWKRYWVTYKLKPNFPTNDTTVAKHFLLRHLSSTAEEEFWVAGCKLEEGNVPTPWSPALEDTQEQIDSKADQVLTQQQLEALEAKRQQMIVEIEAKATLEQVSELTTFLNNLKKEDTDGRQKIIEITKAIEERVKDIEPIMEYSQKLKFVDTYITQGNGGMIIGANDSTTKVVVTPNRISFQDGGSEVAYISQSVLHIDNGVFTMSLQLGHFITRAHPKNQYVNGTYFVK